MRFVLLAALLLLPALIWAQDAKLRAGDIVRIVCEEDPTFGGEFKLTSEGRIKLPVVGSVQIGGMTEVAAAQRIADLLTSKGVVDRATVTVRLLPSASAAISYGGAVVQPGETLPLPGMRLKDLVTLAKPTAAADLDRITITSRNGRSVVVKYSATDDQGNPELHPGDAVYFPIYTQAKEIYLLGAIARPGAVPFVEGMTVKRAIEEAGGMSAHARSRRAKVTKSNGEEWPLDLSPEGRDVPLEPGDKVFVPLVDDQRYITVVGAVLRPGSVEFVPGMTATAAITAAGGLHPAANAKGVSVKRFMRSLDPFPTIDRPLEPFDIVEVPFAGRQQSALAAALRFLPLLLGIAR